MIIEDLRAMANQLSHKLCVLGDPCDNADEWSQLMIRYPREWKALVKSLRDVPANSKSCRVTCDDAVFSCNLCQAAGHSAVFYSRKALLAHERIVHGSRSIFRHFVTEDCRCPVCKASFSTKLRVLAHLCEKRKRGRRAYSCRDAILNGGVLPVSNEMVSKIDHEDNVARKAARSVGKVHPPALFYAKRKVKVPQIHIPQRVPALGATTKRSWAAKLCAERDRGVSHRTADTPGPKRRRSRCKMQVLAAS